VDGIIAAATSQNWKSLNEASKLNIPIVMLDRTFDNAIAPYVGVNNKQGAYLGTKHLIESGHTDIGILSGFQRLSTMRERLDGFEIALDEFGLSIRDEWSLSSPLTIEDGTKKIKKLMSLDKRPSAVFICNNLLSLGALMGLKEMGLKCPDDVAIVAFDDHPWAKVSNPPLTVVCQPTYEIGKMAAQKLLQALDNPQANIPSAIFNCELVVRESV
jgi:LacI family transcriptional regulator